MTDKVRKAALTILNRLDEGHITLDREMEFALEKYKNFSRRDKSLLHALVYGVLRWRKKLDWIIAQFSDTPMYKLEPTVLNILRMGTYQILYLDKIPISAAVNTSVELSKSISRSWIAGFVNGVLRQMSRKQTQITFPDKAKDPVASLSVIFAFPEWLIQRWINRFGIKKTELLCDQINTIPPITVRANTLKTTQEKLYISLTDDVENLNISSYAPDAIYFNLYKKTIPEIPAFKKGWFQIQDEAAQLVSIMLNPKPDEFILDACAGLGGKTGHIAQLMLNEGRLFALDNNNEKLTRLASEMERLGISIVVPCHHDLNKPVKADKIGLFDRILLDAPCSGLGVLRRNPDTKWTVRQTDLRRYQHRQLIFLGHLAPLVKPSGILNYTVCSVEPEETDEVISLFLDQHRHFCIQGPNAEQNLKIDHVIQQGCLRTHPDLRNVDGFYSVNLQRQE